VEEEKITSFFYSLATFVTQITTGRVNVEFSLKTPRVYGVPECATKDLLHLFCGKRDFIGTN
jgi:hypothetical protein